MVFGPGSKDNKSINSILPEGLLSNSEYLRIFDLRAGTARLQAFFADSEIVMVDLALGDDFFKQNRSWDDFGHILVIFCLTRVHRHLQSQWRLRPAWEDCGHRWVSNPLESRGTRQTSAHGNR